MIILYIFCPWWVASYWKGRTLIAERAARLAGHQLSEERRLSAKAETDARHTIHRLQVALLDAAVHAGSAP